METYLAVLVVAGSSIKLLASASLAFALGNE